jgi:hypothetical protein
MSKTRSGAPLRAPRIACRRGAPKVQEFPSETEAREQPANAVARPRAASQRHRVACPRFASNLGEPAGVLSWERDFLLGLALDVLEDFVGNDHEAKEDQS